MPDPNTRPGDLMGRDSNSGQMRIDRVIPLTWLLGMVFAGVIQAVAMYYQLSQLKDAVAEFRAELKGMRAEVNVTNNITAIHTYQLTILEQRISQLERKEK